jgi:hypothetical protein
MNDNGNSTLTTINKDFTKTDIDEQQPTNAERALTLPPRKQLPDVLWNNAKSKYVNDTSVTYMDIKNDLGVSYQTVLNHAKRDEWERNRNETTRQKILADEQRLRLNTLRGVGNIDGEAKAVANYLEGL